jgi:hypothetical protein
MPQPSLTAMSEARTYPEAWRRRACLGAGQGIEKIEMITGTCAVRGILVPFRPPWPIASCRRAGLRKGGVLGVRYVDAVFVLGGGSIRRWAHRLRR